MSKSGKTTYAQSSDIKARSWREYRRDMTKKAIAELEFLPVLQNILARQHNAPNLAVKQNGCDAGMWFRSDGKITREPDYIAEWSGNSMLYEFQYAESTDNLRFFDFKVSKVGKKVRGKGRVPHKDRLFFYVAKSAGKFAFISPEWIMENGKEGAVEAWGSRIAYRVERDVFMKILKDDNEVSNTIRVVDDKNYLLSFLYGFYDLEAENLSRRLQDVIDREKMVKIIPRTLRGMYETCYILDNINKTPTNAGVWLVYLLSFLNDNISVRDMACLMFALDFLHSACGMLDENEKQSLNAGLEIVRKFIGKQKIGENGLFSSDPTQPPMEETRQILFCANMLENIGQTDVKKLFQTIPHTGKIAAELRKIANPSLIPPTP